MFHSFELTLTEVLTFVNKTGGSGGWVDWDLSAIIPVNAKYVEIFGFCNVVGGGFSGVRKPGSAVARAINQLQYTPVGFTVEPVSRIVEVWEVAGAAGNTYYISGYWA